MQRIILMSALILLLAPSNRGQTVKINPDENETHAAEKIGLLTDLQSLNAESVKLDAPLARALAKAEIADAAWTLDEELAKKVLREAYQLTLPDEEEQAKLRSRPTGAAPTIPTAIDRARNDIRNRILSIARRDKAFADQLTQLSAQLLGSYEEHFRYASLASQAIKDGDTETASRYILQSINADPTQITASASILELAARDRKAADHLLRQYIERLRETPISMVNQSALRTYLILAQMVSPNPNMLPAPGPIQPPGSAVMRAYVNYMIESMSGLEQREPGSAMQFRVFLLPLWMLLKQYAPELTGAFLELEKSSRRAGEDSSLPYKSGEEVSKDRYERQVKEALDSGQPDESTINLAINRGDFDKARQIIDLLPDGAQKSELGELVNLREAISLADKGNTIAAQRLARQLNKVISVLQVYPAMMRKCTAMKDTSCITEAFSQAIKQIKHGDTTSYTPPAGISASIVPTGHESDPVLSSLSKLVKAVLPVNETLALEALDETVNAANHSEIDTRQGRIGFDTDIFKMLAPQNEARVRQAAGSLQDRLRQIVALAVIDQWKASELSKKQMSRMALHDKR